MSDDNEFPPLNVAVYRSQKRTRELFHPNARLKTPEEFDSERLRLAIKIQDEFSVVKDLPPPQVERAAPKRKHDEFAGEGSDPDQERVDDMEVDGEESNVSRVVQELKVERHKSAHEQGQELALYNETNQLAVRSDTPGQAVGGFGSKSLLLPGQKPITYEKPEWHAPWKLMRVISGHMGWVRAVATDVSNEWFATGSADRTIKIWDMASGKLKLTLTGHIATIRGLTVSDRHPYLFSCSEDKKVLCWDLEANRVIRSYHGHLSGVYSIAMHPTIDVLVTGGRDSVARVWDIRTKKQIFALGGHKNTVVSVAAQAADPQIITGSMDNTIRLWDLAAGKVMSTLTHHKKAARALVIHPREYTFASAAADNIKKWKLPEGQFLQYKSN